MQTVTATLPCREDVHANRNRLQAIRHGVHAIHDGDPACRDGVRAIRDRLHAIRYGVHARHDDDPARRDRLQAIRNDEPALPEPSTDSLRLTCAAFHGRLQDRVRARVNLCGN